MQNSYLDVLQNLELQNELHAAYFDESRVDEYQDGAALIFGDHLLQIKLAHGENVLVYQLETYELDEAFEQVENTHGNILENATLRSTAYLAEQSHVMNAMRDLMTKRCGM